MSDIEAMEDDEIHAARIEDIRAAVEHALWAEQPEVAANAKDVGQWRRNGAGAQILADLGLGRLRVLGTPRRQVGLAGFGLDVVEYVQP